MEDLQSLMTCLDDISSKIPDGIYLDMADKMKRVHDHMNGNKPFHEDTFYYSDDVSELDSHSDDDSDSDYNERIRRGVRIAEANERAHRDAAIELIRDLLLDYVKSMHQEWNELEKWEEKIANVTFVKRMSALRKGEAIKEWCEKNTSWAPGGEAGELIGCGPIVSGSSFWTWKNLMENGLRTIVLEIGTEEEKVALANRLGWAAVYYDELSLKTLQKLPAFEKKIYDDYKHKYNEGLHQMCRDVEVNVRKHEELLQKWEMAAREQENKLRELDAPVFNRDSWDAENHIFWTNDEGQMVSNGWDARIEVRR